MGRYTPMGETFAARIAVQRHVYRARKPILGDDFLAIEREARAALERACNPPDATRRTRGGKRCAPDLRASGRP